MVKHVDGCLSGQDRKKSPRASYYTYELSEDFPAKEAAPPNRVMHDMVVKEVNDFLKAGMAEKLIELVVHDRRPETSRSKGNKSKSDRGVQRL